MNKVIIILNLLFLSSFSFAQEELVKLLDFEQIEINQPSLINQPGNDRNQILESTDGSLWLTTNNGLYRYNGYAFQEIITSSKNDYPDVITHLNIRGAQFDKYGRIWFGTLQGLFLFDWKNQTLEKFYVGEADEQSDLGKLQNRSWSIEYKDDIIYYLSYAGLWLFDIHEKKVIDSYLTDHQNIKEVNANADIRQQGLILDLAPDFIIGTFIPGFYIIDTKSKKTETYPYDYILKRDEIKRHAFYKGPLIDSVYWCPTYWFGMVSFDLKTKAINHNLYTDFSTLHSRNNLFKQAVQFNDSLIIVFATTHGAGVFNIHSKEFTFHKDKEKNVPILKYADQVPFIDRHGHLYGIHRSIFARTKESLYPPANNIKNELEIYAFETEKRKKQFFHGLDNDQVDLRHDESSLRLEYALICPRDKKTIVYKHKLEGVDQDWQTNATINEVLYSNLKGGKYTFYLEAYDKDKLVAKKSFPFEKEIFFYQKTWFHLLLMLTLGGIIYSLISNRINRIKDRERLKTEFDKKLTEIEMSALRAQMNPHFLFNSLNSIKYYALHKGPEETADYVNRFALLVRSILNNSKTKLISLKQEIKTLKLYLEIEQIRFEKGFDFTFNIDEELDLDEVQVPPMLIQPFVENAIWHGLMHKKQKGKLNLSISGAGENLIIDIMDDGIGRKKSAEIQAKKLANKRKSLGMKITSDRLDLIEKSTGIKTELKIVDLVSPDGGVIGTQVILVFPKAIDSF